MLSARGLALHPAKDGRAVCPQGKGVRHCLFLLLGCAYGVAGLKPAGLGAGLPRSSPEAQGVSSAAVRTFVELADQRLDALHSFMLLRHGHVVAEGWWFPYTASSPHALFSLSKSFTSTAVGLAIAEGKLSVDDEVLKFFGDEAPAEPSGPLKAMRVRDLLRMNTGHETEPPRPTEGSWKRAFLEAPVRFKPGTHFLYNTPATYMLSAIIEKTTGMGLVEYLQPRLFAPLGIESPTWEKSPEGITLGGYGLSLRTEDIARFGQLYLQRGRWQGTQLVPEVWIEAATSFQTSNGSHPRSDWDQGYGYQFWRCRHGAYRGDGAFGQYCIVLPAQEAVIVITAGLRDMQAVLDLVWTQLLPAMPGGVLPADPAGEEQLRSTLQRLTLRPLSGAGEPSTEVARSCSRTYRFPPNPRKLDTVRLQRDPSGVTAIVARFDGVESRIACGHGVWVRGEVAWGTSGVQPVAATGAWTAADTFTARVCFTQTPFISTLSLKFTGEGEELRLTNEANVAFGPTREPELVGTRTADE